MSGLCGWYGHAAADPRAGAPGDAGLALLQRMGAPLTRADGSTLHPLALGGAVGAAAAVAASLAGTHLYSGPGLLVAIWGRPQLARADDAAAGLAMLWRARGIDALAAVGGPFALCILDQIQDEAVLAIDRAGVHALSYQADAGGLLFASSLQSLAAHPSGRRAPDPQAIYDYLAMRAVPAPETACRGQRRLAPGEYLHYRQGRAHGGSYWSMPFDEHRQSPFRQRRAEFLALVDTAVADSLDSRRCGAFLSGGAGSALLAGALCRVGAFRAPTYSIGYQGLASDDIETARIASSHFATRHHEHYLSAADVARAVPLIAAAFDQPCGNPAAVPAYFGAQMAAADGVTRLLGGQGADELFGGCEQYAVQARLARYERLPAALRQLLVEPLLFQLLPRRQRDWLAGARRYIERALVSMPARLDPCGQLARYGAAAVLEADFLAGVDTGAPLFGLSQAYARTEGLSQVNRLLALDLRYALAGSELPSVGRACELAGVELTFPYLHDAMLAFAAQLPPRDKVDGARLRCFFRHALRDTMPAAVLRRRRQGFVLPFGQWLAQPAAGQGLRQLAFDSLDSLRGRGIVRAAFIDRLLVDEFPLDPAWHGRMLWLLMMLEQWLRRQPERHASAASAGCAALH